MTHFLILIVGLGIIFLVREKRKQTHMRQTALGDRRRPIRILGDE